MVPKFLAGVVFILLADQFCECFILEGDIQKTFSYLFPTSRAVKNEKCREHSFLYGRELEKFTLWATQMFDASAKFPDGILSGSTYHLGNFDECIHIKVHLAEDAGFKGKYCLPEIFIDIPPNTAVINESVSNEDAFISTWSKLLLYTTDRSKKPRNSLRWAICIPSTCSTEDLKFHLEEVTKNFKNVHISTDDNTCQVLEPVEYNQLDNAMIYIIYTIISLVLIGTLYEMNCKEEHSKSKIHQTLISFSLITNIVKFFTVKPDPDRLEIVHGLRFYGMFFTVMAHRIMYTIGVPVMNADTIEYFYTYKLGAGWVNGSILIDTFYSITGFITAFLLLKELHNGRKVKFVVLLLHRVIRLTPIYAFVILFYSTLFIHVGSGPIWKEKLTSERDRCLKSWWLNLLYLNNYFNVDSMCVIQSWYIAANMQLFFVSPFIVYWLHKKPGTTIRVLKYVIISCVVFTFLQVYITKLDPTLLTYYNIVKDVYKNESFQTIYIPTHNRISAYLVGMLGGYLKFKMQLENLRIPKKYVNWGWLFVIVSMLGGMYLGHIFYIPGRPYDAFESALYSSLHHVFISASIVWFTLAISDRKGKYIAPLVESTPFIPLSRLSYPVYLSHVGIQMYIANSMRLPYYSSIPNFFWFYFGDVVIIYFVAFVLSMFLEAPVINLEHLITGKNVQSYLVQRSIEKRELKKELSKQK